MGVEGRILLKRLLFIGWMSQHAGVHTDSVCVCVLVSLVSYSIVSYSACTHTCELVSVCACQHSACPGVCVCLCMSVSMCVCARRGENQ